MKEKEQERTSQLWDPCVGSASQALGAAAGDRHLVLNDIGMGSAQEWHYRCCSAAGGCQDICWDRYPRIVGQVCAEARADRGVNKEEEEEDGVKEVKEEEERKAWKWDG